MTSADIALGVAPRNEENTFAHRPRPIEPFLFLYITEKCQLRCQHCYMGDRLEREHYMSPRLVDEILSTLRIAHGQYKVYLLGGEPTLHPQFGEILQICRRQSYKVVLTSNGLISPSAWRHLTPDQIDSFSFSLDGARAATHESMRGPSTFAPLVKSMKRAVDEGYQTRAIMTVTTLNVGEVVEALGLADEIGLEMLSFHYFTPTGRGRDHPEMQLPPSEWGDICETLRGVASSYRVRVFYPPAFVDRNELARLTALGYPGCTARNLERLAIFPDRRVYICSAFFDTDLHYGEFRDGRVIPRAGAGATELTLVNRISSNCRGCPVSSGCKGGCAAYDHFGRTLVSDDCDRQVIPICPLWSVAAEPEATETRLQVLR